MTDITAIDQAEYSVYLVKKNSEEKPACDADIVRLNLRIPAELQATIKIIAIKNRTTPEKLAVGLLEKLARDEGYNPSA